MAPILLYMRTDLGGDPAAPPAPPDAPIYLLERTAARLALHYLGTREELAQGRGLEPSTHRRTFALVVPPNVRVVYPRELPQGARWVSVDVDGLQPEDWPQADEPALILWQRQQPPAPPAGAPA